MRICVVLAIAACSSTPAQKPAPITQRFSNQLDLLFVMDNSSSTSDLQTILAANFPKLVQALDAFPGGRPSLHIGVTTSTVDIGTTAWGPGCPSPDPDGDGLLQNTPRVTGCSPPAGQFIVDDGATKNYSGLIDQAFSCIAQVGSTGCGFEADLEGMKRALDGSRAENAGFLRDDANLGVLILTDEDDCSAADPAMFDLDASVVGTGDFRCTSLAYVCDQPISISDPATYTGCKPKLGSYLADPGSYADFLHAVRPEQRVAVSVVSGTASDTFTTIQVTTPFEPDVQMGPACMMTINGNPSIAKPAIRLASFLEQVTDARWDSICQSDYSAVLTSYGQLLQHIMQPCLAFAVDPTHCTATRDGVAIPICADASSTDCVSFTPDASCGTPTNLAVHAGTYSSLAVTCDAI